MSAEFDQQGMAAHVEIYQQWDDGRILKQIVVTADLPEAGRRPDAEGVDRDCRRATLEEGVSTSPQLQESAAPALPIGLTAELHV